MNKKQVFDDPDVIERELKDWDKVRCHLCGQTISMLSADSINNGSAFIHRGGRCGTLSRTNFEQEYLNKWE